MAAALLVVALIAAGLYMALTSAFSPQETAQNGGANATLNASGENAADNGGAQAGGNGSGNSDEGATGGGTTDEQGNDDDAGARRPESPRPSRASTSPPTAPPTSTPTQTSWTATSSTPWS